MQTLREPDRWTASTGICFTLESKSLRPHRETNTKSKVQIQSPAPAYPTTTKNERTSYVGSNYDARTKRPDDDLGTVKRYSYLVLNH
jgi:hypothetical protein